MSRNVFLLNSILVFWLFLPLGIVSGGAIDPVCGPEILTVADAWMKAWEEFRNVQQEISKSSVPVSEQRIVFMRSHLEFMNRRSVQLSTDARREVDRVMLGLRGQMDLISQSILKKDQTLLSAQLSSFEGQLGLLGRQYPPAALEPGSPDALVMSGLPAPIARVVILDAKPIAGRETRVKFGLRTRSGRPIRTVDLQMHQEHLLHALLLDPTFSDFHHAHPVPLESPGDYEFVFVPKVSTNYRMWINLVPLPIAAEEFPFTDLLASPNVAAPDRHTNAVVSDGTAMVRLNWGLAAPRALRKATLEVEFRKPDGSEYCCLEPYMGTLAHIVGISEDYRSILHLHPAMDSSPVRSATPSSVRFELIVPRPGFARLFLQTQSAGQLQLRTFGAQFLP